MLNDKDVNPESSTAEQEDQTLDQSVSSEQKDTQSQTEETKTTTSPSPRSGKETAVDEEVDERGVPWKNRALEYQRKLLETSESLPKLIEETIAKNLGKQQPQEQKMSFEQLEAFALEKPEYRPWVEAQKEKLREEREEKRINDVLNKAEASKKAELKKQEALGYVISNYSEMFHKDANGRAIDWNNDHPMTQLVSGLMKDPRFSSDPEGLIAATEIAFARHARTQMDKTQKEVKKVTQKLKKVENQNLVEGNGKQPVSTGDSVKKAISRLAQTGSNADAEAAVVEYMKKTGRIK